MYYIPVAVFMICALYGKYRLPNPQDARFLTHPDRGVWSVWRFMNRDEWTEQGLKLRSLMLIHWAVCLVVGGLAVIIIKAWEH